VFFLFLHFLNLFIFKKTYICTVRVKKILHFLLCLHFFFYLHHIAFLSLLHFSHFLAYFLLISEAPTIPNCHSLNYLQLSTVLQYQFTFPFHSINSPIPDLPCLHFPSYKHKHPRYTSLPPLLQAAIKPSTPSISITPNLSLPWLPFHTSYPAIS